MYIFYDWVRASCRQRTDDENLCRYLVVWWCGGAFRPGSWPLVARGALCRMKSGRETRRSQRFFRSCCSRGVLVFFSGFDCVCAHVFVCVHVWKEPISQNKKARRNNAAGWHQGDGSKEKTMQKHVTESNRATNDNNKRLR